MVDVLVVGGGIAGVSVAAELAERGARVHLAEAETALAHHTTGRSAALYFQNYGGPAAYPLNRATWRYLQDPGVELDAPLVSPRAVLHCATAEGLIDLDRVVAESEASDAVIQQLEPVDARRYFGALDTRAVVATALDTSAADIDVAALHQVFVRRARTAGAVIDTSSAVRALEHRGSRWLAVVGDRQVEVDVVVNAAGAWGDDVASLAGIAPVGLQPLRRTAFMVAGSEASRDWAMLIDAGEQWYIKPDGSQFLCSPADVTLSDPCDARPEPEDIALAIERINEVTTLAIRSVRSSWAGLRTFAPDHVPVAGYEPTADGFFWLVGQGGFGIQTSAGLAELAARLVLHETVTTVAGEVVNPATYSPARFRLELP